MLKNRSKFVDIPYDKLREAQDDSNKLNELIGILHFSFLRNILMQQKKFNLDKLIMSISDKTTTPNPSLKKAPSYQNLWLTTAHFYSWFVKQFIKFLILNR